MQEWSEVYKNFKDKIEEVDVSTGVASVLAVKDEEELVCRIAILAHSNVYSSFIWDGLDRIRLGNLNNLLQ